MELLNFLVFAAKVVGLIFIIGLLLDLIVDVVIMTPIKSIMAARRKKQIMDLIINKLENGEDLEKEDVENMKKEIDT